MRLFYSWGRSDLVRSYQPEEPILLEGWDVGEREEVFNYCVFYVWWPSSLATRRFVWSLTGHMGTLFMAGLSIRLYSAQQQGWSYGCLSSIDKKFWACEFSCDDGNRKFRRIEAFDVDSFSVPALYMTPYLVPWSHMTLFMSSVPRGYRCQYLCWDWSFLRLKLRRERDILCAMPFYAVYGFLFNFPTLAYNL